MFLHEPLPMMLSMGVPRHCFQSCPLSHPVSCLIVALSLSMGWGIRGNFGHEAGAMIAGVLSSLAVAVLSGRQDWRERVLTFAFLGALGWGFGGSIAYMYPISFTESGHALSTYFGFFALFLEGGLWCGMGVAGLAMAAVMPSRRLNAFFKPLCFVLAALWLRHFLEEPLEAFLAPVGQDTGDDTWQRHKSPLYWFDADWLQALMALMGICIYDLWDRRSDRQRAEGQRWVQHPLMLLPFLGLGGVVGYTLQLGLRYAGWESALADALVVSLGDPSYVHPTTGLSLDPRQLLTNWPQFFSDFPEHLGWGSGLLLGGGFYFYRNGLFRRDASLLLHLSLGWLVSFLLLPTLGSIFLMSHGGLRVMPPRSDDWAGILGVFVAAVFWFQRNRMKVVAKVMSIAFILGGISFATMPMIRYLMRYPGHPWRFPEGVPASWSHYQSANWHSILEQMHGFGFGCVVVISMVYLWKRQPRLNNIEEEGQKRWTRVFAAWFVIFGVGFLNLHKLVDSWLHHQAIPEVLKAPLLGGIEATPGGWFNLVWWSASFLGAALLLRHLKRPLEVIPSSPIGKGQMIYLLFLWMMILGNLMRAIPGFNDGRMVTEWVLFMNGVVVTGLLLTWPASQKVSPLPAKWVEGSALGRIWLRGLVSAVCMIWIYGILVLTLYQEHLEGKPWANHKRFGPEATWRIRPILKHGDHP